MIVELQITNEKTFEYLEQQLSWGKILSNQLLNLHNLRSGKCYAIIPSDTTEAQMYSFETGSLYPPSPMIMKDGVYMSAVVNESKPKIYELIRDHLNADANNCCIFEEPNGAPKDPWVAKSKIEYTHIGQDMFYFFNADNNVALKIEQAFLMSEAYYLLCVLSSIDIKDHIEFEAFKEITAGMLKTIADNCSCFFAKAYDGEGYVMWKKAGQ